MLSRLAAVGCTFLALGLGGAAPVSPTPPPSARIFSYSHDGILGTSLDLQFVAATPAEAARAERVALDEIERLRQILSSWDSTSELSRLVREGRLDQPSPELVTVLRDYEHWHVASGGAYTARVAPLTALWREAARQGASPSRASLDAAVARIQAPAWRIDDRTGAITVPDHEAIDVNSLGKGFIIDRTVEAIRREVPGVRGGLVNIGGDIRVWGAPPTEGATWQIGVADPADPFDNGTPMLRLALGDQAISSSGSYARGFDIGGTHHSHIIDPRTGQPADAITGVTVLAADNATANALATTLSVLGPGAGMALLRTVPGAEALWVTADHRVIRSPGFATHELPGSPAASVPAGVNATIEVDLSTNRIYRHRPYVAMWITDTAGNHVRTLAFWGDRWKYQRELRTWWGAYGGDRDLVDAVTRATRRAGQYTFEWDGTDQAGDVVKPGPYEFWLEAAYEDGPHSVQHVTVTCGKGNATGDLGEASAFTGGQVHCGSTSTGK